MIAGYGCKPVFQYKFKPLAQNGGAAPVDGGFCIILYENGILSFSVYNAAGVFMDELCFTFPGKVLQCFYGLLRNASSWLPSTPANLTGTEKALYGSCFAYDGYDPIHVFGMNSLMSEPCGSPGGFFARHMYVLFEDVCNLFAEYGVMLSLDGFSWDADRIHPFRKNQVYTSGQQRIVI